MNHQTTWDDEAEVVVVGYGGAGAISAITAHDIGTKVFILERQSKDTATRTRHTPATLLSAGFWLCPLDWEKTDLYLQGIVKIANETLDYERREIIRIFARYLVENTDWMARIGIKPAIEMATSSKGGYSQSRPVSGFPERRVAVVDFPGLPGSESAFMSGPAAFENYRHGAALFKGLSTAVTSRNIPIMWNTRAMHLVTEGGKVCGVIATQGDKELKIRASRAVILACGGFEFNEHMKENYLRVNPVHFCGNPDSTGDGINMAMEIGAALWHMNAASWRVTMKFPDFPVAFITQQHEIASIIVDKRGKRFSNERFKIHAFGYELTSYDCYAMCYPRLPCYWVFDEKRRSLAPLASFSGPCNPPGGIMGDIFYIWSADNKTEIEHGWILKANTLRELAAKIHMDPDNRALMESSVLEATVREFNHYCRRGEDLQFHKPKEWLQPLEDPPFYAVKLWPGGPNTQGGPKRNARGQVLRVDNSPVPRLYSAGELGSVWGMLYQAGGNLGECIAFGRISGANAAAEKPWK